MTAIEGALLRTAEAVVSPVLTAWLGRRRARRERGTSLIDLVNTGIADDLGRRRARRRIEEIFDAVYERLRPLVRTRFAALPDYEVAAVLDAITDTFVAADLSDAALFADNIDASRLASRLRRERPNQAVLAGLTAEASRLYTVALDECCVCLVQLVIELRPFQGRAMVELLDRLTAVAGDLATVLGRVPQATLQAPTGVGHDGEFRIRYCQHLLTTLDYLELFGVDVHRYRLLTALSVAYIGLAVSGDAARRSRRKGRWDPGLVRHGPSERDAASVRVEQALGSSPRILLRGEAGSGKTTLLQWIAVTAARAGFTGELSDWNDRVPFLVRLRGYVDEPLPRPEQFLDNAAALLAGLMPAAWVHRRLSDGAVLCVDGVDEVPEAQRRQVREWLRGLLAAYPDLRVVVTSRPAAAAIRWLSNEGFTTATLERMSPTDVRALIQHWHDAVLQAGDLPCEPHELAQYEQRLLAQLDGSAHLQALAASPLLCAMLCALNLDRDSRLPRNRMDIYRAAADMLLERRDAQRGVLTEFSDLTSRDRLQLMQQIAWWLTVNGRTELTRDEALHQINQRLAALRQVTAPGEAVLTHLAHRSGMLREPVPDRIDFVHRTFQEYLAAREAAEQDHAGALVGHAHLDTWRETIVLAAGHANAPVRRTLLEGILDRATHEPTRARRLRLLAAACLETAPAVDPPSLLDRIRTSLRELLPPRSTVEAQSLAAVGEPLLTELPTEPDQLTEAQAVAIIRAAALVNGQDAIAKLARFTADSRRRVQRELIAVWEYFDPIDYAERVLANAQLDDGAVTIRSAALLPALARLGRLIDTEVAIDQPLDLAQLTDVPHLKDLALWRGYTGDLARLADHTELSRIDLSLRDAEVDLSTLTGLPVTDVWLRDVADNQDLTVLDRLVDLKTFALFTGTVHDLSWLQRHLQRLEVLALERSPLPDFGALAYATQLRNLQLWDMPEPPCGLERLLPPDLTTLSFYRSKWVRDLGALRSLRKLQWLHIGETSVEDLAPLADHQKLKCIHLGDDEHHVDLTPLAKMRALREIWILAAPASVDLTPLRGKRIKVHLRSEIQLASTGRIEGVRIHRI